MPKKTPKLARKHQPFHFRYLASKNGFVSYCIENGLRIDQAKLEQLHKEGWLFPALRIMRGVVEFKKIYVIEKDKGEWKYIYPESVDKFNPLKIAKEKYYISGTIGGRNNWLSWYEEKGMVKYPSLEKFKSWNYARAEHEYLTDWREINRYYEFFYDKRQMFLLKHIISRLNLINSIKDNSFKQHFTKELKQNIKRFYSFLNFYIAIEDLSDEHRKEYMDDYEETLKDFNGKHRPALLDMKARFKKRYYPQLRTQAKSLLKKYEYSLDELEYWQRFLASKTLFGEARRANKQLQVYLKGIREETLAKAEDGNFMLAIINEFMYWLTGTEITLHYVLGNIYGQICVICHNPFHPNRDTQVTCGRPICVNRHKNELKKGLRKRDSRRNGT